MNSFFNSSTGASESHRLRIFIWITGLLFAIILGRLFFLQVVKGEEIRSEAYAQRSAKIEITPQRGKILTRDSKTGDLVPLAINTTQYEIFVDPSITSDPEYIAKELTALLYTEEEFQRCEDDLKVCPPGSVTYLEEGAIKVPVPPLREDAKKAFYTDLKAKITPRIRTQILLATQASEEMMKGIEGLAIPGVRVSRQTQEIWVDGDIITPSYQFDAHITAEEKKQREAENFQKRLPVANALQKYLGGAAKDIADSIAPKPVQYVKVLDRVPPTIKEVIEDKKTASRNAYFKDLNRLYAEQKKGIPNPAPVTPDAWQGVGFSPQPSRYYPEGGLLAQSIGFVDAAGKGNYGVEEKFDSILRGEKGVIEGQRDIHGNAVEIQGNTIQRVKNGADIVLTVDRIIQQEVEKVLSEAVEKYDADSGQVIVMDPQTGKILAMAGSPSFDPNFFGNVYLRERTSPKDRGIIYKTTPLERKDVNGNFVLTTFKDWNEAWDKEYNPEFYRFENRLGPGSYLNKSVMDIYEPGSVIKPIVMAAGIDDGEITEYSRYIETEPMKVGKFEIKNSDNKYLGSQTMTNILERSANLGMVFVTQKMEKPLVYDALKKFGFGEYINMPIAGEVPGIITHYKKWSDAQLLNAGFGQGFAATPLQVIRAWSVLANNGYMVNPYLVDELDYPDGSVEKTKEKRTRVIDPKVAESIKRMLISATENGVAKRAQVPGFYIAGKTGTSQISRIDGPGYESLKEDGNTITSFIGYAPVDNPRFLILVKFDRPRVGDKTFGSTTASPTFAKIMEFVLHYTNATPDKVEKNNKK